MAEIGGTKGFINGIIAIMKNLVPSLLLGSK